MIALAAPGVLRESDLPARVLNGAVESREPVVHPSTPKTGNSLLPLRQRQQRLQ